METEQKNIFVIDDKIPIDKIHTYLGQNLFVENSSIHLMLSDEVQTALNYTWEEPAIKDLINSLSKDSKWNIVSFNKPQTCIEFIESSNSVPDIIIFDWDTGTRNPHEYLKKLLDMSYCLIQIYTFKDKEYEVEKDIIKNKIFIPYIESKRLSVEYKDETKKANEKLIKKIDAATDMFSFKFGNELRHITTKSLEKILCELSEFSSEDIVALFGNRVKASQPFKLNIKEFANIIIEKFREDIKNYSFVNKMPETKKELKIIATIKKLWALRLYHKPSDNIVRNGDIVQKEIDSNNAYLVISSNCHLHSFWKKNAGILTMLPLHRINKHNSELKKILRNYKKEGELKISPSSLTNTSDSDFISFFPGITFEAKCEDYLLFTKEVINEKIHLPDGVDRDVQLTYDSIPKYKFKNRLCLNESFKNPMMQHILTKITGYGVADFPSTLTEECNKLLKEMNIYD